jgi:hypothetical protein
MHRIVSLLLLLGLMALAPTAFAGEIIVRDQAALLTADDVVTLKNRRADFSFDVVVLAENAPDAATLEDHAHQAVDRPNLLVVAIDPGHQRVVTRFGTGLGVKMPDRESITAAGNAHLRAREPAPGILAILYRAKASAESAVPLTAATGAPVVVQQGLSTGTWVGIGLVIALFVGLAVWLFQKLRSERSEYQRALDENREETSDLRTRNIEAMTLPTPERRSSVGSFPRPSPRIEPSYYPPTPAARGGGSVVVTNNVVTGGGGGSSDLATGILLGEALARPHERERIVYEPAPSYHRDPDPYSPPAYVPPAPAAPSYDGGGSSSSYGSSSSSYGSSSSYDSGGSSSSFDSGGGGGGGGGGGD